MNTITNNNEGEIKWLNKQTCIVCSQMGNSIMKVDTLIIFILIYDSKWNNGRNSKLREVVKK